MSSVSTVRDKNSIAGVNFRKISRVIVVCYFDKNALMFYVQTKWQHEQNFKPMQRQKFLKGG